MAMRIIHDIDPFLFRIHGGIGIRWYALPYILGFVLAYVWLARAIRNRELPQLKAQDLDTFLVHVFLGVMVGARFFHVFVFEYEHYGFDPLRWIAVWRGGLSFHGGLVGAITGIALFARRYGVSIYAITDRITVPVAIALGFGRIGNFINAEMPGTPYDGPMCVDYSQSRYLLRPPMECRHPTQLYEMGKNWLIAGVLWVAGARFSLRPGVITWAFIALYGFIRFWLMFVRDETRIWLGMTQSQVFSGIMAIVGVVMVVALMRRGPAPVGQSRAGPAST
jgi:phosphatidylglycerol---prolipoprotein diacylglyceryl transferase